MNCGLKQKDSAFFSINLLITGFVSSSLQLLLIREIMNISGGFELISGIFLASWLIGSAAGAILAGRWEMNDLGKINLLFATSPLVSLTIMILFTRLFMSAGETPSFLLSMFYTFVVLFPFCLFSGYAFVRLTTVVIKQFGFSAGKSFATETIGGIIAGVAITILTAGILNTYQLILLIVILNLSFVIICFYMRNKRHRQIGFFFFLALSAAAILMHPDIFFRQLLLPGLKVVNSTDTPYGNISVSEYSGEKSVFYNQRLVYYNNDEAEREEDIHYAMLQHNKPERVLLISGGLKSHLPEILKYDIKEIVYIERDPSLIREEEIQELAVTNTKITIETDDAYRYIKNNAARFDVIICLIPPPSTLSLNRYYTTDFFKIIKSRLNPDGIFLLSSGQSSVYYNKESINYNSTIFNSLKNSFTFVEPIIGNKLYLISSDYLLSTSICSLTGQKEIKNLYVNPNYLSDDLIKIKSEELLELFDRDARKNSLMHPVSYFQYMAINISKEKENKPAIIALISLLFILPVSLIRRKNLIMYLSASALAGIEIIALIVIQLTLGNLYHITGLIIASVMAGLAAGAGFLKKNSPVEKTNLTAIILILFYVFTGIVIDRLMFFEGTITVILMAIIISFIPAFLTGRIFRSLSCNVLNSIDIGKIYGADLAGSAFGFLAVSGFMLSVLGIQLTIFMFSVFIIAGMIFGTIGNKNQV